eukprot:CAMPEP_0175393858 /NCGR_PEP_ID=MMETSP0095-20121207/33145_1 /TAXON_ID=311494 /ORGANISM="Alexandrium monilatum, Strain CCMP3105" /LENGTH=327 /DNA_ID=CAMNT_0016692461 /DNA_START=1 /DNA_END=981 /DNA_ORIENTATION=-
MAAYFPSPGSVNSTVASESDVRIRVPFIAVDEPPDTAPWQKRGWCLMVVVPLLVGTLLGADACRRFSLYGRDVWVYKPRSSQLSPMQPLPVVVVLHGSYGCALQMAKVSGFQELAEEAQFIVVYPEMKKMGSGDWGFDDPSEVTFFTAMVEMLGYEFLIYPKEVFVCGFSAGGTMALFLQNNYPGYFYAAASVEAGIKYVDQWNNKSSGRPVAVVWNHNDEYLQDYGGRVYYKQTISYLLRDPARDGPTQVETLKAKGSGMLYAKQMHWDAWGQQPPVMVVSWASTEPSHVWPSPANIPGCFDAARVIWKFFVQTRSSWGGVVPIDA